MQHLLRLGKGEVALVGARCGDRAHHQCFGGIDEYACGGLRTGKPFDPPARQALGVRVDACCLHCEAVGPAGMAVDPLEIDRTVGYRAVEFGGGRKPAKAPFLLVPAAPENPRPGLVFGGEPADLVERLFERSGVRQVERQRADPDPHDMRMRIDQPRDHHRAFAVFAVIGLRLLVLGGKDLRDFAVVVDDQCGEALDRAVFADGDAFDIVDQHIGLRRCGQRQGDHGGEEFACHFTAVPSRIRWFAIRQSLVEANPFGDCAPWPRAVGAKDDKGISRAGRKQGHRPPHPRRCPRCRGADRRRGGTHPDAALADLVGNYRGRHLAQVREPPVHRGLQGTRRAQCAAASRRGAACTRRHRRLCRQSLAGAELSWPPPGRAGDHRDARNHAQRESDADAERWRRRGAVRRDLRRGLCPCARARAGTRANLRPPVRRSAGRCGAGHGGARNAGREGRFRLPRRADRRRRVDEWDGDGGQGAQGRDRDGRGAGRALSVDVFRCHRR